MASKQKIRIKIQAYDHKVVDDSARLIIDTAEKTGAIVAGPIPLPSKIEKVTVNRATFVHKKAILFLVTIYDLQFAFEQHPRQPDLMHQLH
jgi:ribosomal protein S10